VGGDLVHVRPHREQLVVASGGDRAAAGDGVRRRVGWDLEQEPPGEDELGQVAGSAGTVLIRIAESPVSGSSLAL
jgi:hypothetical protein